MGGNDFLPHCRGVDERSEYLAATARHSLAMPELAPAPPQVCVRSTLYLVVDAYYTRYM